MTKNMVNAAVLVAVLTVAVLAPSTTFAATQSTRTTQINVQTGIAFLDAILSMIGYKPVRTAPTQAPTAPTGSISGGISTDGAIWGGKCPYGC